MFFLLCSYFENLESKDDPPNTEVLFKRHHVTHTPWGEYDDWNTIPLIDEIYGDVPLQEENVKVKKLCHITHIQSVREITKEEGYFNFKPARQTGKANYNKEGLPIEETYIMLGEATEEPPTTETKYRRVSSQEDLFPGYYSWWSVDLDDYPEECEYYCFSQFYTSSSCYGNNKFSGNIVELLQCYQEAYNTKPLPCIQFRCGGTLRYKQEIRKVVIVCTDAYPLPEDEFPLMWESYPVKIEEAGKIKISTAVNFLEVKIHSGVTGLKENYVPTKYSWDTYAFGFYFPDNTYSLKCSKSVIEHSIVGHNYCTKKQYNESLDKLKCPNYEL